MMKQSDSKILKVNAVLNVIRQLASIAFPMITFPYVTRILGVTNYGRYNFTASIITYISLIAGLGISNYAIREGSRLRDDKKNFDVFINEIVSLNAIAMLVAYLVLLIIVVIYRSTEAYSLLLLIQGISVFFSVVGCEWLNVIYEDYRFITFRYLIFQTLSVLLTFIFVKSSGDLYKYALISQFVPVFANLSNILHFYKRWDIRIKPVFRRQIFSHLKYVLILFANAVSMLIYVNSDMTIIGIFNGDYEVGIYSVAVKVYTIVKQLLNALLVVAIPRMARLTVTSDKKKIDGQLNALLKGLLVFLIPTIVGVFCLGEQFITIVSGPDYVSGTAALKVLAITLLFSTGVCFYSNLVLIPNNMEKHILKATIISAVINIVLNLLLIPRFGYIVAAYTTLLSEAFSVIYMLIVVRKKYFPSVFKTFVACIISGGLVWLCCFVVSKNISDSIFRTIVSVILSIFIWAVYWLIIRIIKKKTHN